LFDVVESAKSENLDDSILAYIISAIPVSLEDARKVQEGVEKLSRMGYSFDELGIIIE
jgi:hypothetical protein